MIRVGKRFQKKTRLLRKHRRREELIRKRGRFAFFGWKGRISVASELSCFRAKNKLRLEQLSLWTPQMGRTSWEGGSGNLGALLAKNKLGRGQRKIGRLTNVIPSVPPPETHLYQLRFSYGDSAGARSGLTLKDAQISAAPFPACSGVVVRPKSCTDFPSLSNS